jgi:hypothetical protein
MARKTTLSIISSGKRKLNYIRAWKVQNLHRVSVMAEVTYFVALPFVASDDGWRPANRPNASTPTRLLCVQRRCRERKAMSAPSHSSRTGDPATGDFSDATVLRKFGDVAG